MAQRKSTVRRLLANDDELTRMQNSIHWEWNEQKITTFYGYNASKVEKYKKKLEDLQTEWMVMENGRPKVENRMPVLLPGKSREDLDAVIKAILDEEVYITY